MSLREDRGVVLALIAGMMMITVIVLGVMAFAPLDPFSHEDDWSYQGTAPLERLELQVEADVCDVTVAFEELAGGWIEVSMRAEGRAGYIAGEPEINFTVATELDGGNLTVSVLLDMDTGPTVHYKDSDIMVTVDRSLLTFFRAEVDVGDVTVVVPGDVVLAGAAVHAKVGGLHLTLEEGAMVLGDLQLEADVGSVNVNCVNAVFAEGATVGAKTGTGSIRLDLEQGSSPGGNATFDCLADVGSVYLTLRISGDVAAEITSQANVGDIETDLAGFSGMDVHLLSDNHPDLWTVKVLLKADVGSVHVDAEWRE